MIAGSPAVAVPVTVKLPVGLAGAGAADHVCQLVRAKEPMIPELSPAIIADEFVEGVSRDELLLLNHHKALQGPESNRRSASTLILNASMISHNSIAVTYSEPY